MERGVVKDDDGPRFQSRQQFGHQPFVKNIGVACAGKRHRCDQFFVAIAADQTGAWACVARDIAVDFLPDKGPAVGAARGGRKARFINIDNIALFLRGFVEPLQEPASVFFIALCLGVTSGFFYG